jgi:hypothetical protein
MSSQVFNLDNVGFEKYLNDILKECNKDVENLENENLEFEMKTDDEFNNNKSGKIFILKDLATGENVRLRLAVFYSKDDTPIKLIFNMKKPTVNSLKIQYISFLGCKDITPPSTVEETIFVETTKQPPAITVEEEKTDIYKQKLATNETNIPDFIEGIEDISIPKQPNKEAIIQDDALYDEDELQEIELETVMIETIPEYRNENTDVEIIQTITNELALYYSKKNIQKSLYTLNLDSISFLDLLKKYRANNSDGIPIRNFKFSEDKYSPYYELIKKGRYDSIPIYPIIINVKNLYRSEIIMKNDVRIIETNDFPYYNFNSDSNIIYNYIILYKAYLKGELNYKQFMNYIIKGGTIELIVDDEKKDFQIKPFFEAFSTPKENQIDYHYYDLHLENPTNVIYYGIQKAHPINLYTLLTSKITKDKSTTITADYPGLNMSSAPQHRITNSIPTTYQDITTDVFYNESKLNKKPTQSCTGTTGGDVNYTGKDKSKDFYKDFYKSIIKSPNLINLTDTNDATRPKYEGEQVCIIGFYIPTLEHMKNYNSELEIRNDKENKKFYPKILNTFGDKSKGIITIDENNLEIIEDVDNFKWSDINPEMNYMVLFKNGNKKLNDDEFKNILEKLLPNINTVIDIQKERIKNCLNFIEMQKILSEYSIDINNINTTHTELLNINELFKNNTEAIKKLTYDQKTKLRDLKKYISTIQSIYHELLLLKWKNKDLDLNTEMTKILNSYEKITLYMFYHYYMTEDVIKCIEISDYENITVETLVSRIIIWFMENSRQVEDLSEFYKWFSTQSIDINDAIVQELFDRYIKLFKLDKLLDLKSHGTGIYDQYFLREMQMIWNLNHNYNGGRHILEIFQLIQIIKYQQYINQTIES